MVLVYDSMLNHASTMDMGHFGILHNANIMSMGYVSMINNASTVHMEYVCIHANIVVMEYFIHQYRLLS